MRGARRKLNVCKRFQSDDLQSRDLVDLIVNGSPRTAPAGTSVASLLKELGIAPERVAVERNRDIVDRERWGETVLRDGDRIEIIQFVGGGAGRRPRGAAPWRTNW